MLRKKYLSALVFLLFAAGILFSSPEVRADLIEGYVQCDTYGNQTVSYQTINPYGNVHEVMYRYGPSCGRAGRSLFPAGCPAIPGYASRAAAAMAYLQMGRPGSLAGALGAGMAAELAADAAAAGCR